MKRHAWILPLLLLTSPTWAQAPLYQGKTITVIAAASAGSAYDLYARLMAQFMGKHLPGNPSFIVQNMTGAGSIIGANYIYNVSKPDGFTIGAVQPSIYFNQLMKQKEVRYDWAKFSWIGSSDKSDYLLYMRADLPYKTLADVRKAKEPPKCGSTGCYRAAHAEVGRNLGQNSRHAISWREIIRHRARRAALPIFTIQAYHSREPYHTWRKWLARI
jgi:tripartite-type tricarboxylate transporter receptor subunit TctC